MPGSREPLWIVGAAMTPFRRYPDRDLTDLASEVALAALDEAACTMIDIGVLAVGNLNDSITGPAQRLQHEIGQTGIPAFNVSNACATGASAVRIVATHLHAGEADIGLAVGVEKLGKAGLLGGSKSSGGRRFEPQGRNGAVMKTEGILGTNLMPGVFSHGGTEFAARTAGVGFEQFARVAEKNHFHSTLNPYSMYRKEFSLEEIMAAEVIAWPNTLLMCCPTSDGAAAVVLTTGERLAAMPDDVQRRAVKMSASVLTTDPWSETGQAEFDVNTLTRNAADMAYEAAGVAPEDLDLVELHDCFATAELCHYENLRLCEPGGAGEWIDRRGPWRDGETPVNVSGGLLSKGHPIGATAIAGLFEVVSHLRGEAGDRQIEGARVGLAHVIGLGSSCGIHVLERRRQ